MENNKQGTFTEWVKDNIIEQDFSKVEQKLLLYVFFNLNGKYEKNYFKLSPINFIYFDKFISILNSNSIQNNEYVFKKKWIQINTFDLDIVEKNLNQNLNFLKLTKRSKKLFISFCFLARGWVNTPTSRQHHLEIKINNEKILKFIDKILKEFYIKHSILKKGKNTFLYIKKSSTISDFLKLINASSALLYFEDERIVRDMISNLKKSEVIEKFNDQKSLEFSSEQISSINKILSKSKMSHFTLNQQKLFMLRVKNKNLSLNDLTYLYNQINKTNFSRSTINNWLNKVVTFSKEI